MKKIKLSVLAAISSCKGLYNKGRVRLPTAFAVTSVGSSAPAHH